MNVTINLTEELAKSLKEVLDFKTIEAEARAKYILGLYDKHKTNQEELQRYRHQMEVAKGIIL